jgi:hypothetical protein
MAPAGDDGGDGQRGGVARRLEPTADDEDQGGDAGGDRHDERGDRGTGQEAVGSGMAGVGVQDREAGNRECSDGDAA